jgi:hypothetical protein
MAGLDPAIQLHCSLSLAMDGRLKSLHSDRALARIGVAAMTK